MKKLMLTVFTAGVGIAGAATVADAGLFSATRPVIAIVADELFVGEAEGHLDGSGTLAIRSQKSHDLTCAGTFTSSAEAGGTGQMRCSDGATAIFYFKRLSAFSGYGTGSLARGAMTFAYGMSHEDAGPYLQMPQGKKLLRNGTELALADL